MLKLYNKEHEAISAILNIKDYKIEYLLSGEDSLEFSLSISDENINLLQEECYIRNELNEYVVKEIDPNNDFKRFNCILNLEDIKAKSIFNFETENNNIDDTIRLAIAGTGWVLVDSNITKRRTVRLKNTNALEVLREIRKVFKIDYRFDSINKKIYAYELYGNDKGVYFSDELNLTDLKFPSDTYEYITRIIPIGKDGLKISSVNCGKEYIDNFQYTNKVIEYIWEDNRYTDAHSLKDDAIAKLNELSKPKKVYEANVYDLAKYSDEYNFLEFFLGDTITILSKKDNFKDKQRIVKYIQYPKEPYKNTCELGNTTLTFEELQQGNEYKNQVLNNITTDNNTLDGSKVDEISTTQIKDFDVEVGRVVNLEVVNAKIDNLVANDVNITGQLNAVKADIGTLNANVANIDELVVKHTATINELNANKANISDLNATNATIDILESRVANIDHILAGNITADNIQAGTITAGSGIIADGAIGNAQISSINAGKIEAGTIDTSKITVAGPNSNLKISGNRLQVFTGIGSNQFERVSLGDVNGDGSIYGFRVRGADGQTILIDENGVKKEGITDGSITNEKISDNANIDGSKLDINSVVRNINKDGTEVIQGTKINVNGTNLETKLSTITQKQTEDSERITQAYSKITANENKINLKVDNQTYQTDKNNINTTLNKNTSEISLLKDKIALKVEQTDITNAINNIQVGGRNLIKNSLSIQLSGTDTSTNTTHQVIDSNNGHYKIIINNNNRWNRYQWLNNNIDRSFTSNLGEKYTISMDVKVNKLPSNDLRFSFNVRGNGLSPFGVHNNIVNQISKQNIWIRVYSTVILPTDNADRTSVLALLSSNTGGQQGLEVEYKNLKLEKGSKGTDWSLAPEDITSEISAVDSKATTINNRVSEITANLNSITQRVSSTETTTTSLTTQINAVDGKINTAKNEAITGARQIPDTRSRNENPLWYIQNYPRQTITEFKYANVIGIGSSAIYGTLETKVPWSNNTGGYPVQTFRSNSTATYERKGESDTAWGAWKQIEDTSGAQAKANQALGDAKSYTNEEITKTNNKVSSIETNLNGITSRVGTVETKTTNLEKITEKKLINNFSNSNTLNLWSAPGTTLKYSSIVGYYMDCLSNNLNHMIQSEYFEIDSSKSYKISLMQQFAPNSGTATFYFGIYAYDKDKNNIGVYVDKATSLQTNPYFMNRRTPANDSGNWRTWSGCIYSHDTIIQDYTPKGNVTSCMKFSPKTKYLKIRFLHYRNSQYGDSGQGNMYFAQPAIYEIDNQIVNTEQRLRTAEQKITDEAITNTVKQNFYTKGDVDSKGYQTASQVQQAVDSFQIKFSEGGGYNLVRNSTFKNNDQFWSVVIGGDTLELYDWNNQRCAKVIKQNTTNTVIAIKNLANNINVVSGRQYALSYITGGGNFNDVAAVINSSYDHLLHSDGHKALNSFPNYKKIVTPLTNGYYKVTITFTSNISRAGNGLTIGFNTTQSATLGSSYVVFSQVILTESAIALPWSPHPSEVYDGITTIDKDGITVTSSNVRSKTSMTANGFKITKINSSTSSEDVFKVNSNGDLELYGTIRSRKNNLTRAELVGDGLSFYNGTTLIGKMSHDNTGAGNQQEAANRLWLRTDNYALKVQADRANASFEANNVYIKGTATGGVVNISAPTIYLGGAVTTNGMFVGQGEQIKLGRDNITFATVGQTKEADFLRLSHCYIASSSSEGNSIHFLTDISGGVKPAQVYGGPYATRYVLEPNHISRSISLQNKSIIEKMKEVDVVECYNGKKLSIKRRTYNLDKFKNISYLGLQLNEDGYLMDYTSIISTLWQAVLELSEESTSLKRELEDLKQSLK